MKSQQNVLNPINNFVWIFTVVWLFEISRWTVLREVELRRLRPYLETTLPFNHIIDAVKHWVILELGEPITQQGWSHAVWGNSDTGVHTELKQSVSNKFHKPRDTYSCQQAPQTKDRTVFFALQEVPTPARTLILDFSRNLAVMNSCHLICAVHGTTLLWMFQQTNRDMCLVHTK